MVHHHRARATWSGEGQRRVHYCWTGHVPGEEAFGGVQGSWSGEQETCGRWRETEKVGEASCDHWRARVDVVGEHPQGLLAGPWDCWATGRVREVGQEVLDAVVLDEA